MSQNVFAVLLCPPVGKPRVIEVPPMPKSFKGPVQTFKTRDKADAALEKFFTDNPEYRNWNNGSING